MTSDEEIILERGDTWRPEMTIKRGKRLDPRLREPGFVASLRQRIGREPIKRIAVDLNVTPETVRNWARRFHIALPRARSGRPTNEKRGLQILGLSSRDPVVAESLRLLLHREEYSYTDVAMMFDVSRERVRQWTSALGIMHADEKRWKHGLSATRLWDDQVNRFVPVPNSVLRAQQRAAGHLKRRTRRVTQSWQRREEIIEGAERLRAELGHEPNLRQLVTAVLGNPSNASELYRRWFGRDATRKGRAVEFKESLAEIVGWQLRDGRRDARLRKSLADDGGRVSTPGTEERGSQAKAVIIDAARSLHARLGRRPTLREVVSAAFGDRGKPSIQRLVRSWCGSTSAGESARFRNEFHATVGWELLPERGIEPKGRTARLARSGAAQALRDLREWVLAQNRGAIDADLLDELARRLSAASEPLAAADRTSGADHIANAEADG